MEWMLILLVLFTSHDVTSSNFRFAHHYGDHMVLQRDPYRVVIWGFGDQGAIVNVSIVNLKQQKQYKSTVKRDSRGLVIWKVTLDPIAASGPYAIKATSTHISKVVTILLKDVYFGDVWLCGGQSNMAFTVSQSANRLQEAAIADHYKHVRLMTVRRYGSATPIPELSEANILQKWSVASKESVEGPAWAYFSALCWMYGRRLYDQYKIPIGLISSNYGGTPACAWSSPESLAKCNSKKNRQKRSLKYEFDAEDFNPEFYMNDDNMDEYRGPYMDRREEEEDEEMKRRMQSYSDDRKPTHLWNAMIYPLQNMTIYGAIWYQGEDEANGGPAKYNCTFPALIEGWRKEWFAGTAGQSNYYFPFGFVQLSGLGGDTRIPADGFPTIRWKQTAEYGYVPNPKQLNTFMAVAMDTVDEHSPFGSIHPRDKTTLAERLMLGARAVAYHETNVYWTGPIAHQATVVKLEMEGRHLLMISYKPSSLRGDGIQVRNRKGFEVLYQGSTSWVPIDILAYSRAFVVFELPEPLKVIAGVRYAWNRKPCLNKQCAIYAKGYDLPSPPFVKHGPVKIVRYSSSYEFEAIHGMVMEWLLRVI